jgi:hypothetical protein
MQALGWLFGADPRSRADSLQFGLLLGLMFLWLAGLAAVEAFEAPGRIMSVAFLLIAVQAMMITARSSRERGLFLVIGLLLLVETLFVFPGIVNTVTALLYAAVLVFIPVRLSVFVLEQEHVDANTVFGALCAYLFLGLSFAVVYNVLVELNPAAIFTPEEGEPTFVTWVYFSFTTLSTLGYGDIAPRTYTARMLAILEALIGQIYLVVVVARLVGDAIRKRASQS